MRTTLIRTFLLTMLLSFFTNCKDSNAKETSSETPTPISEKNDPWDEISEEQKRSLDTTYFYVIAPSGLSLRTSDSPASEKITTMPLGSKVKQLEPIYTMDMTIENIPGSMMAIGYNDQKGYAFSGFLSPFPPPKEQVNSEDYVKALHKKFPNITYTQKRNDPDFHEGYTEYITLPNALWHEAYFLASALYDIPSSLPYPNPKGIVREVIEDPQKESHVWSSDLGIYRNDIGLDSIKYSYRIEGFGFAVTLRKAQDGAVQIEHLAFVD